MQDTFDFARTPDPHFPETAPTPPAPTRPSVRARLRAAARIAFLRHVPGEALSPTWLEILAAAFLTVCVPTLFAVLTMGSDGSAGRWSWNELPGVLFLVPLALVAAAVIAWLVRRNDSVATLVFATLLAWIVIDGVSLTAWGVLTYAFDDSVPGTIELLLFYGPLAWLAIAVGRFAIGLVPVGVARRGWVFVASALLLAFPMGYLHPERSLWVVDWSKEKDAEGTATAKLRWAAASEDVFYKQPELLARELAAVEPGRKGVIDVFFVGMAGHAYQDVFMREVDSVAKLMRERFGADGHIVKLVNNSKTSLTMPIASTTSLRASLKRTAEMMDVEEDVLVLFLTSHGSAKHRFSLDLWPLRFNELNPAILRQILDESGIRNRVVIVSACYAGGFVETLKDDRTVVIAAAAPDKNSFGCSNEAEWTYFGKAYFDEALRETRSFTHAFDLAKPVIAEREKAQKYEPSDPTMAAGEAIKVKLAELEKQLTLSPALGRSIPAPEGTPGGGRTATGPSRRRAL